MQTIENTGLLIFTWWGMLLMHYRSSFRKIANRTVDCVNTLQTTILREIKALLGYIYPTNKTYIRKRNFYQDNRIVYFHLPGISQFP